jgi:DNA polymerase I-like protein with 3'-5' exonuclease and polymerase domains
MTKKAMLDLYKNGIIAHVQIHDELCISVKDQKQADEIVEIMQNAVTLEVPNKVDCELANNWGDING